MNRRQKVALLLLNFGRNLFLHFHEIIITYYIYLSYIDCIPSPMLLFSDIFSVMLFAFQIKTKKIFVAIYGIVGATNKN
jgi:hypothetical protein